MTRVLYDSDNNKVEVMTDEEIEEQKTQAAAAAQQSAKEVYDLEKGDLESKITDLTEEVTKAKDKEENVSNLRNAGKEEKEQARKEREALEEKLQKATDESRGLVVGGMKDDAITELAGDDEEFAEAIKANYDRIIAPESTKAEIKMRVQEAHALTLQQAGVKPGEVNIENHNGGGSSSGSAVNAGPKPKLSSEASDPATLKKFGLTEKDVDQHLK